MDTEQPITRYLATWDRKSTRHQWRLAKIAPWPKWNSNAQDIDAAIDSGIAHQSLWPIVGLSCELDINDQEPRKSNDRRIIPWEGYNSAGDILDHFDAGDA